MADGSRIEWTDATWNPVTGCSKVSPGCKFCYAEVMARRLRAMGQPRYANGFKPTMQPDVLGVPARWKSPRVIFVNSMSDLFHDDVSDEYIGQVFRVMNEAPQHTFQVLTKRSERLRRMAPSLTWSPNIWMGVSVEDVARTSRVHDLQQVPASVRFLSVEPLLEAIPELPLNGIHWVIVGGESGRAPREIDSDWVRDIRTQCEAADVHFFFKQWGGTNKKKTGRELDGQTWDARPALASSAILAAK